MGEDDPLAWIRKECHVSVSQDEMLRNAAYAHPNCGQGSDALDDEAEMGSEETVVMVSISETSAEESVDDEMEDKEEEEYRTPPERHSRSLTSSNEAMMVALAGEDGCENAVDCGGKEDGEKTVDLSRDSEMDSGEFKAKRLRMSAEGMVMQGECLDRAVKVSEGMKPDGCIGDAVDVLHFGTNSTEEEEIEGRQQGFGAAEGSKLSAVIMVTDEDMMMEEAEVPPNGRGGVARGAEIVVEGNHKSSVEAEIMRIDGHTDIGDGKSSGAVEVVEVNELQFKGKNVVDGVEIIRCAATSMSFSGNASSENRRMPSSVFTGSKAKADSGVGIGQDGGIVRTHQGDGIAGGGKGDSGPKATKGDGGSRAVKGAGGAGKKASEPSNKELADNIFRVLDYLVKRQEQKEKPVYKEKFDIIQSAINAGLSFPRPSWRPEYSDNDSD